MNKKSEFNGKEKLMNVYNDNGEFPYIFEIKEGYSRARVYKTKDDKVLWTLCLSDKHADKTIDYKDAEDEHVYEICGFVINNADTASLLSDHFRMIADKMREGEDEK